MLGPLLVLSALVIWVGVYAGPFIDGALAVGAQIVDPTAYITAVLGPRP